MPADHDIPEAAAPFIDGLSRAIFDIPPNEAVSRPSRLAAERAYGFLYGRGAVDGFDGETLSLVLLQARFVLRNLNHEHPGCGYDKLGLGCEAAAYRVRDDSDAVTPHENS